MLEAFCSNKPFTDAGMSLINLKRHGQWVSNRVVAGCIANSLPLRKQYPNCLLSAEKKEEVEQVNSKNSDQPIQKFDSYVDLFSNSNLPVAPLEDNEELNFQPV